MGGRAGEVRQAIGPPGAGGSEGRDRELHCGDQRAGGAAYSFGMADATSTPRPC